MDGAGTVGKEPYAYMQVDVATTIVMVVMQLLERAWPWLKAHLIDMLDYDPQMGETERSVLVLLPTRVFEKERRVGVSGIVSGTRYSPVRALSLILCSGFNFLELSGRGPWACVKFYDEGRLSSSDASQ